MKLTKYLKKFIKKLGRPSRRQIIKLVTVLVCLLIWFVLQIYRSVTVSSLYDQNAAARFSQKNDYTTISTFFVEGTEVKEDKHREFYFNIQNALTTSAITKESEEKDARLFIEAYSTFGTASLINGKKNVNANVIGTGGDFFYIHPVELVSGMYYMPDAVMQDQILVDESVAWQLFGSSNIAGQTVSIGSKEFIISGVVRLAEGRFRKAAGYSTNLVYMPFSALAGYGAISNSTNSISTYEVVMPNPVKNFARDIVKKSLGVSETQMEIVDSASRYGNFRLFELFKSFGLRSMTGTAVRYPYWENIARGVEDILLTVLIVQAVCLAIPICIAVWTIIQAYRHKKWTAMGIFTRINEKIYDMQSGLKIEKLK